MRYLLKVSYEYDFGGDFDNGRCGLYEVEAETYEGAVKKTKALIEVSIGKPFKFRDELGSIKRAVIPVIL